MKKKICIGLIILLFLVIILGTILILFLEKRDNEISLIKDTEVMEDENVYNPDIEDTYGNMAQESFEIENSELEVGKELAQTKEVTTKGENSKDNITSKKTGENEETSKKSVSTKQNTKQEESKDKKETSENKEESNSNSTSISENTETNTKDNQNSKNIDLSKYNYYEKGLNGTYKGFIEDKTEINKLRSLINETIENLGYKDIRIIEDSSLAKDGTRYFTANKTNVENLVYDSEGFDIYYYAVKEYFISADGEESYFQTRSYIKVK